MTDQKRSKWDIQAAQSNLPFAEFINFQDNSHANFIKTPEFGNLLRDKLQLGPNEAFKITIHEPEMRALLEASSSEILSLAIKNFNFYSHNGGDSSTNPLIIIPLGFDPAPELVSFVRGKILGPQGSFLKHIQDATRTKVQLKGRGSGYIEVVPRASADSIQEAMHLSVHACKTDSNLVEARQLCEDLLSVVKVEYDSKIAPNPTPLQQQQQQHQLYYQQYAAQYAQYAQYMAHFNQYYTANSQDLEESKKKQQHQ